MAVLKKPGLYIIYAGEEDINFPALNKYFIPTLKTLGDERKGVIFTSRSPDFFSEEYKIGTPVLNPPLEKEDINNIKIPIFYAYHQSNRNNPYIEIAMTEIKDPEWGQLAWYDDSEKKRILYYLPPMHSIQAALLPFDHRDETARDAAFFNYLEEYRRYAEHRKLICIIPMAKQMYENNRRFIIAINRTFDVLPN